MWPSGLGFTTQETTDREGREGQSILEVKMSTEDNNLDKLAVTETSPGMTSRNNPWHMWCLAMGEEIKETDSDA